MSVMGASRLSVKLANVTFGALGTFSGYGAIFGNEDRVGDVVEPGAFAKTLARAKDRQRANRSRVLWPLLFMHRPEMPIGAILSAYEDPKGLFIQGEVDLDSPLGREAFSGMAKGYVTQLSIGYSPVQARRDGKGIRHLQEIGLAEISAVTSGFAANIDAVVTGVKSVTGRAPDASLAYLRAYMGLARLAEMLERM